MLNVSTSSVFLCAYLYRSKSRLSILPSTMASPSTSSSHRPWWRKSPGPSLLRPILQRFHSPPLCQLKHLHQRCLPFRCGTTQSSKADYVGKTDWSKHLLWVLTSDFIFRRSPQLAV